VAIVNTNPDLVRLLRVSLEQAGFIVLVIHIEEIKLGEADLEAFLTQHNPKVIVYDVAPPYDQNWRFLDHLRASTSFKGRRFVLTTVNLARVQEIVGPDETVHEVVGRSDDLEEVVRAVKEASRARETR
jgi:CheY-like chemotaxis protein